MTVQDLRPNSQDTSAFYLGNIYEVLADPNVTRAFPVAKPPPFSRPRYAIWANSLLFLSLVISLSCALLATLLQQWARRYIRLTQPARRGPEKRARMRAFYADGVEKMHIPWAVEGLPVLIHLSLFLFFGGLAIFLFNVDVEVFTCVFCWIGLFLIVYGLITLLPLIRHDSPYYTPLSKPVWFLKVGMPSITHAVLYFISYVFLFISRRQRDFEWHYDHGIFLGLESEAEETADAQSSDIDVRILDWTIHALGDDNSQEKFFQTIPGLFSSDLVNIFTYLPPELFSKFWRALDTFIRLTTISNSVSKETKSSRVDIAIVITSMIPTPKILDLVRISDNDNPENIYPLELMTQWFDHWSPFISWAARAGAANMLTRMKLEERRDYSWREFACKVSGLSVDWLGLRGDCDRDNMLLATVIHSCRQIFHFPGSRLFKQMHGFIPGFGYFDIRRTFPWLQGDFCKLWNELVQEARKPSRNPVSFQILYEIRQHYIAIHQSTDPFLFDHGDYNPSAIEYPLCDIPSHYQYQTDFTGHLLDYPIPTQSGQLPDASPYHSAAGGRIVSRQDKETITAGPPSRPHSTTSNIIGGNSRAPAATDSLTTAASPPGAIATALQDIPPAAMVSYTLRGTAHSVAPVSTSASNPLLPTSYVINLSITAVPPPSHAPPLPGAESITLPSTTTPFHPAGNTPLPRLRARGFVNIGGVCFSNAVLQLLVHSPPFWDVFRELGDLKGQLGAGGPETATPLVDATVRFFEEFIYKEKKPLSTQQALQQAMREIQREDEEEKKEHNAVDSFEPTYMYDAMKEKSQLKDLLVRSRDQDSPFYR